MCSAPKTMRKILRRLLRNFLVFRSCEKRSSKAKSWRKKRRKNNRPLVMTKMNHLKRKKNPLTKIWVMQNLMRRKKSSSHLKSNRERLEVMERKRSLRVRKKRLLRQILRSARKSLERLLKMDLSKEKIRFTLMLKARLFLLCSIISKHRKLKLLKMRMLILMENQLLLESWRNATIQQPSPTKRTI